MDRSYGRRVEIQSGGGTRTCGWHRSASPAQVGRHHHCSDFSLIQLISSPSFFFERKSHHLVDPPGHRVAVVDRDMAQAGRGAHRRGSAGLGFLSRDPFSAAYLVRSPLACGAGVSIPSRAMAMWTRSRMKYSYGPPKKMMDKFTNKSLVVEVQPSVALHQHADAYGLKSATITRNLHVMCMRRSNRTD